MVARKGTVLGIFALILGILSLGVGGYSLYRTLTISPTSDNPKYMARAYLTASYAVSTSTWHTVNFTNLDYNVGGCFDLNTDSFNCSYTGYYLVSGMVSLDLLYDEDIMLVGIYKNNTVLIAGSSAHASHVDFISAGVVDTLYLEVGDSIQLKVWHSFGVNRYIYGNPFSTYTYLSIILIEN